MDDEPVPGVNDKIGATIATVLLQIDEHTRGMYVERASMTSATWPMFPLIQAVLLRHSSGH